MHPAKGGSPRCARCMMHAAGPCKRHLPGGVSLLGAHAAGTCQRKPRVGHPPHLLTPVPTVAPLTRRHRPGPRRLHARVRAVCVCVCTFVRSPPCRCSGVHEVLKLSVAVPFLWGVPPQLEVLKWVMFFLGGGGREGGEGAAFHMRAGGGVGVGGPDRHVRMCAKPCVSMPAIYSAMTLTQLLPTPFPTALPSARPSSRVAASSTKCATSGWSCQRRAAPRPRPRPGLATPGLLPWPPPACAGPAAAVEQRRCA